MDAKYKGFTVYALVPERLLSPNCYSAPNVKYAMSFNCSYM